MKSSGSQPLFPLFKFPTRVVAVDDNEEFVTSLKAYAANDDIEVVAFSDPIKAANHLESRSYLTFIQDIFLSTNESRSNKIQVKVNFTQLYNQIYNPNRFSEVSALITDFNMPKKNGRELCEQIIELPIQKVLLAGYSSTEMLIDMFNNGLINKSLDKQDESITWIEAIKEVQREYFIQASRSFVPFLGEGSESKVFFDQHFYDFFNTLCEKNNIVEYYTLGNHGGFLLADGKGSVKRLIVRANEEMQALYEMVKDDPEMTPETLNSLKLKEKLIYHHPGKTSEGAASRWELSPASSIEAEQHYYYALIDEIPEHAILGYYDHLQAAQGSNAPSQE